MEMDLKNKNALFWQFTIGLLILLPLPLLFRDGMFMDAVQYTAVAHNMANGIGTFWFPQFTLHNIAGLPAFHEQPPLSFGIQAIFFKIFGNSYLIERFYTFLCYLISIFLNINIWRNIYFENEKIKKLSWLPLLFWITIPQVFWSFSNNMIENTMGIFILLAVLFQIFFLHRNRNIIYLFIAGFIIFLATFTKGIPGLFPLALPFIYWAISKKVSFRKMVISTFILLIIPVIVYTFLMFHEPARESLTIYVNERLLYRINENPTVSSRFYILRRAIEESLIPLIATILLLLISRYKKIKLNIDLNFFFLFLLIGLSGILPLMLTKVQRGFYIVPALPFIAMAYATVAAPYVAYLIDKINIKSKSYSYLWIIAQVVFSVSIVAIFINIKEPKRDKEMLEDVHTIGESIPEKTILSTTPEIFWFDWSMQSYLSRHYFIVVDTVNDHNIFLTEKDKKPEPEGFYKVNLSLHKYDLYKR